MQKYSFLENIEQAVCLIGLVYHNNKHEDTFIVQFNSYFKQNFPEVDESNVFDKFSDDFKTNVLDAFSREEDDSAFDFIYQDINYQVLKIKLDSNQYAFLFKMISRLGKSKNYQDIDLLKGGNIAGLNFLAETFDKASIMVVVTNLKGKIEYVNEEFTKLTEYTSEEAVGRNANILNSGKQLPEFYQQMWATLYEGKVWNNSFHNRKKTGQLYWQRTYMIPLTDESGKITRFVALGEDITESKAVETVVEEKTDLLFQLLEGTPDIVCVKDGDGRWLMANSSMKKLFELEKVSFYGKTTIELAEYSKHHKESLLSSLATDIEAWTTKTLNRKDEIIPMPDGVEIILDIIKIPSFNPDGSRKRLVFIGRDVTIRKKAIANLKQIEKRYTLAQKTSGIASWEWDLEKLTLNWSDNLEEIFGSANLFDNKKFNDVIEYIHPDDRFVFLRKMLNAIQNLEEYNFEIRIYDVHQNVKWVKLIGLVHDDELNSKSLLLGIIYDITERKNFVKDLIAAKMKAEESDRLKSTFLATMSHELRTPLNAVIGFSDIILSDLDMDPELMEFIRLINNNGLHLLNLIEDIFDLSLIESKQVKIYKDKFDLLNVLHELAEVMPVEIRKLNKEKEIEFINELPNTQIIIDSDASRITQIISNLLKNAIKFTHEGYVKLGILEEDKDVIIFIEDSGIGISEEKQKIIFDIFRQGEESLTRQFGGAGLGLSISNNLSELLGGKLSVKSEVGKGSVFSFKIKRDLTEYHEITHKEQINETMDWSDKYVLIAEDEFSNYELLMYMLKPTNIKIKQVTNGNDAIREVLNIECPDLVLMDIKMPELNGFEATKSIKEVYPDLPIIAQTAFAIAGDREMALEMGCDDYISKPIKKSKLLELMKNYLS